MVGSIVPHAARAPRLISLRPVLLPRFIEEAYNESGLHSAFGYLTPVQFEEINRPAPAKSAA